MIEKGLCCWTPYSLPVFGENRLGGNCSALDSRLRLRFRTQVLNRQDAKNNRYSGFRKPEMPAYSCLDHDPEGSAIPMNDSVTTQETQSASFAYCQRLTETHYENFTVVNWFLPKALRPHLCNIYAYCRTADDLADESPGPEIAKQRLLEWRNRLEDCYQGRCSDPVFIALRETILEFDIPMDPFSRLLDAFLQDQVKRRYQTWEELLGYCRNSANPVGHIVLYLFGYRDAGRRRLSDHTCTALQLLNFWQDVDSDLRRGRIYIPLQEMERFGYSEQDLLDKKYTPNYRNLMQHLCSRTRDLFQEGRRLLPLLGERERLYVRMFSDCGERLLDRIENRRFDVFQTRPVLTRWDKYGILVVNLGRAALYG